MKKTGILLISIAGALIFAGCSSTPKSEETTVEKPAVTEEEKSEKVEEIDDVETVETTEKVDETTAGIQNGVDISLPEGNVVVMDDFEEGLYWSVADLERELAVECNTSIDWGTEGDTSLECVYKDNGVGDKATYKCESPLDPDWKDAKYIALDVNNPNDEDIAIVLVVQSGDEWTWNQTDYLIVEPGTHTLVYNISNFKNLGDVHVMFLCAVYWPSDDYPIVKNGKFYIDNYRVIF